MIAAATLLYAACPPAQPLSPSTGLAVQAAPMDDERFWSIIERSGSGEDDNDRQASALRMLLLKLPLTDVESFQAAFDAKMARSYSWDLWGAAFVIHGGASDDGFAYFRRWLISRGRRTFEAALANPDALADFIPSDATEPLEFEEFGAVAMDVWSQRTGKKPAAMPMIAGPTEPIGTRFREDEQTLAARWPRLWKRFGVHPLDWSGSVWERAPFQAGE